MDKEAISINLYYMKVKNKSQQHGLSFRKRFRFVPKPAQTLHFILQESLSPKLSCAIGRVKYNYPTGPAILLHGRIHLERIYTHPCHVHLVWIVKSKDFGQLGQSTTCHQNHLFFARETWNSSTVRWGSRSLIHFAPLRDLGASQFPLLHVQKPS